MTMSPPELIDVRALFPGERAALLELLASLDAAEWAKPTACAGWSVQDVAAHLLGDDVGRLAGGRDGQRNPAFWIEPGADPWTGLVAAIDRQNAAWVETARRISPPLLIDFLRLAGEQTGAHFRSLDLKAIGGSVDWAGPEPAPVWLDLAREYTERWVHQQHIRDAVARPGLKEPDWFHPVLATFAFGVQRALAGDGAAPGAVVRLTIVGDAGGTWDVANGEAGWRLVAGADQPPVATVELDQETAWRLFTRGIAPGEARQTATLSGDPDLGRRVLETVSILA